MAENRHCTMINDRVAFVINFIVSLTISGESNLHRQKIVATTPSENDEAVTSKEDKPLAVWSMVTSPLLTSPQRRRQRTTTASESSSFSSSSSSSPPPWRIWTACSDGLVREFVVTETSAQTKAQRLDASALQLSCTHHLVGSEQDKDTDAPSAAAPPLLGCSALSSRRLYTGEDDTAGDLILAALDLSGRLRVWVLSETMDEDFAEEENSTSVNELPATAECVVSHATGTTAVLAPIAAFAAKKSLGSGVVVVAVACLDGSVALVSTGIAVPSQRSANTNNNKSTAVPAVGSIVDRWGSPSRSRGGGLAVPLALAWSPNSATSGGGSSLAVGRQDGSVDVYVQKNADATDSQHSRTHHHYRLTPLQGHPVRGLAYTTDGHLLVAGNDLGRMCVWDCSRRLRQPENENPQSISTATSAPTRLAPALVHHAVAAHRSWVLDIQAADARRWMTCGADGLVRVWEAGMMMDGGSETTTTAVHSFDAANANDKPNGNSNSEPATQDLIWCLATGPTNSGLSKHATATPSRFVAGSDAGWLQVFSMG